MALASKSENQVRNILFLKEMKINPKGCACIHSQLEEGSTGMGDGGMRGSFERKGIKLLTDDEIQTTRQQGQHVLRKRRKGDVFSPLGGSAEGLPSSHRT